MRNLGAIGVRHLAERKGRSLLTGAGIVLGVALFVGALIATSTTNHGVERLGAEAGGLADVIISPAGSAAANLLNPGEASAMTSDDAARLSTLPGVVAAGGVVGFPTAIETDAGRSTQLAVNQRSAQASVVGLDLADADVFPVRVEQGTFPAPTGAEIAIPARLASDLAVTVGHSVRVATPTGDHTVTVTALLADEGVGRLRTVVFTSIGIARELGGQPTDTLTFVGLRLEPGEIAREWAATHEAAAGPGLSVTPASEAVARFRDQLAMLSGTMTVLAAAVLFSAGFLIHLTLSMTVVERTRLYGTLQALGATRRQIRRVVVAEALGMGLVATALGVGLGVLVAAALNTVAARFLTLVGSPALHVPAWTLIAGGAFGLLTTLLSALLPARRAGRLDPVTAMQDAHAAAPARISRWLVGVPALIAGLVVLDVASDLAVQALALIATMTGAALLVGPLIPPLARSVRALVSRVSAGTGEIAVLHLAKEPARSAATLALVMLVMAMTFACGAMTVSYVRSLEREIDRTFTSDLNLFAAASFDEDFLVAVQEHPLVEGASARSSASSHLHSGADRDFIHIQVIDPETYFDLSGYFWSDGDDATARSLLERGRAVILPTPLARRLGVVRGDHVVLETTAGPVEFEVAALAHLSNVPPSLVVGRRDGGLLFGVAQPQSLAVNVVPGVPVSDAAAAIERDLGEHATFIVATSGDMRADSRAQILGIANGFFVLLLLAGFVGLFGMANTLAVSIMQRSREIGVLRAIGARRRQVGGMAVVEAMTLVLIAFVLAVPLGGVISGPLLRVTSAAIGDFEAAYIFPWVMVPIVALLALAVGAAAALWPARRAASIEIDSALRFE